MNRQTMIGCICFVGIIAGYAFVPQRLSAQTPEFRTASVVRFEWADPDPAVCQAKIDHIMQGLKDANFNAVLFQVRGQCDVLYPSPYEVWSPFVGEADPGWDPVAYAIDAAHGQGLEFHAYINTHTCWQHSALPSNPTHTFWAHCNASDPDHRDWLIHDEARQPVQWGNDDYVWIAPGVPAFQAYLRQQIMYLVQTYDIDGVHIDRIRTTGGTFASYDPISQARQASPQSNPNGLDYDRWTADQITRTVRDLYAQIMSAKPQLNVSASVFYNPILSPNRVHQEALVWAQTGCIDTLIPMMYLAGGAGSSWDDTLIAWLAGSAGRHVVAGQSLNYGLSPSDIVEQIVLTRTRGAQGNSIFYFKYFDDFSDYWDAYKTNVYQTATTTPDLPWKQNPTTGIIYGYVKNATEAAVADAQMTLSGSPYVGLSSGDGLYSFLQLAPGSYSLTAMHQGYDAISPSVVQVAAGQALRHDINFGALLPSVIAPVSPNPDSVTVGQEYTRQLTLSQGTVDTWELIDGPVGASVNTTTGHIQGWTPTLFDVGHLRVFDVSASNVTGSDDETWVVEAQLPDSCTPVLFTDFEDYEQDDIVLFNRPSYSGSTQEHLAASPNEARVVNIRSSFSGHNACMAKWQFIDADPTRWLRLCTMNNVAIPNPMIAVDRPIRVRLRLDSGRLRLAVGVRETQTTAPLGADGGSIGDDGTLGDIEFVGASTRIGLAPQGVLVEAQPGVWQTFVFDPQKDPIYPFTGNGLLHTANNLGVFEHLAFSIVDTPGPFTVYIDDVEQICPAPADYDQDDDVDLVDFSFFERCFNGPNGPMPYSSCSVADFDGDNDVDQSDFGIFQRCISGADNPGNPDCAG